MTIPLQRTETELFVVNAPQTPPRRFEGEHGTMWQWVGDGRELISWSVAARETRLGTARGSHDHLVAEIDRLIDHADAGTHPREQGPIDLEIEGAAGASYAVIDEVREGIATHNRVAVATDRRRMFVFHAMVTDTDQGRALAEEVLSDIELR